MTSQRLKGTAFAFLLAAGTLFGGSVLAADVQPQEQEQAEESIPLEEIGLFADIFGTIKNYYVDEVPSKDLIENAIRGMVEGLDPHSSYLDFNAFKDMEESTMGEFGGLGLEVTKDAQGVRVVNPIDDTPAAKAGVMAGDLIVKIDGKSTADLSLNENVKLMRGKPKTSITLTIARKGVAKPIVIKLMRDIIKIQSVKSKSLGDGLAYIRISQFQERTATDVADALMKLNKEKPLKGVVLDLRNNSGGLLNSAIGVSAAFIKPGSLVVSTRGRNPEDERKFNAVEKDYATGKSSQDNISHLPEITKTVPVVVLINSASASASEIVAGALQDHKRATIMGTRSFGKGSVQTIIPIRMKKDQTTGVKITTARYYTPSGRTIQATGITPDIAVDDTPEGNYPSFSIREAELAHHLEVKEEKKVEQKNGDKPEVKKDDKSAVQKDKNKKAAEEFVDEEETTMPKLRYMFGDEKDFPLQQAKAFLKGEPVVTHEETQAKLKADRDKKKAEQAAKDKKQNKAQSKNTTETEKK